MSDNDASSHVKVSQVGWSCTGHVRLPRRAGFNFRLALTQSSLLVNAGVAVTYLLHFHSPTDSIAHSNIREDLAIHHISEKTTHSTHVRCGASNPGRRRETRDRDLELLRQQWPMEPEKTTSR